MIHDRILHQVVDHITIDQNVVLLVVVMVDAYHSVMFVQTWLLCMCLSVEQHSNKVVFSH
jgi:hypothetical protein